ncbi:MULTISPECIES: hypothetical protein [unclassified Rhodococcus (in: high G+C Gram-positive bacteria)]|uniref:hypothetical protein n=1 Tax=unclassified Rhodococcus (in: high G+C Gram-positive bacteria) TaxID=192944 RepID=UPI00163A64B1|nr:MULTISPECIES: hypothetical protein [unclassified Rhodococcus (in: high G+C Gram-positive bacteria)]MBC2640546.1 hypothetical protein [Rhodococcus sp. 3A]MBC2894708.1 hypothetical protein [Rhodococcus sp. 4CII]
MKKFVRSAAVVLLVGSIAYYLWCGLGDRGRTNYGIDALSWVGPQMIWPIVAVSLVMVCFALTGDSVLAALTQRNSAAFRHGAVGIGTVRSVRQTGMTLNDQPEVRIDVGVEGADGKMFESHARMIVPLTELALLQPGVVLPVRYLPNRTDKVEIDRSGDMSSAQEALNRSMIRQGITTPGKLDIAARGIAAQAVVQSLSVPGEIRNGNSKVALGLVVTRPDGTTFTTRVEKFLPPRSVAHVQVGRVVTVHYLPGNEQEVVIALPANV